MTRGGVGAPWRIHAALWGRARARAGARRQAQCNLPRDESECPVVPRATFFVARASQVDDLSRGKVMRHGTSITGKPCLYVFADKHSVHDTTQERTQELVIYSIEQTVRTLGRTGGAVVIFDFKDAPWSAMDTDAAKYVVRMLSLNYPESLDRILIVNYGMLFSALWTVISPFLSARTTAKVKFVTEAQLTELIAPEQLPVRLGGTADVEPDEIGDSRPVSATS